MKCHQGISLQVPPPCRNFCQKQWEVPLEHVFRKINFTPGKIKLIRINCEITTDSDEHFRSKIQSISKFLEAEFLRNECQSILWLSPPIQNTFFHIPKQYFDHKLKSKKMTPPPEKWSFFGEGVKVFL